MVSSFRWLVWSRAQPGSPPSTSALEPPDSRLPFRAGRSWSRLAAQTAPLLFRHVRSVLCDLGFPGRVYPSISGIHVIICRAKGQKKPFAFTARSLLGAWGGAAKLTSDLPPRWENARSAAQITFFLQQGSA